MTGGLWQAGLATPPEHDLDACLEGVDLDLNLVIMFCMTLDGDLTKTLLADLSRARREFSRVQDERGRLTLRVRAFRRWIR